MTKQHWGLVAISLAMCMHALWIGQFLGSPFAIVAMAWLWIGGATALNRLEAAQVMAIVMSVLLLAASIGLGAAHPGGITTLAHLSLALCPAVVAFACVALFVRHLRQQAVSVSALDWAELTTKVAAMPISKPKAKAPPPVAAGSGDGPLLPNGANDHETPAALAVRNTTQAA